MRFLARHGGGSVRDNTGYYSYQRRFLGIIQRPISRYRAINLGYCADFLETAMKNLCLLLVSAGNRALNHRQISIPN